MIDDRAAELATLWSLGNGLRCALTATDHGWDIAVWQGIEIVRSRVIQDGREAVSVAEVWRKEFTWIADSADVRS
jgi:hypothetical protein